MANALARLVDYPNTPVFDVDPKASLAIRVRNPAGLKWVVADGVLSLVTGENLEFDGVFVWDGSYDFGVTTRSYTLADMTVAQLADALAADGHEIAYENPDLGSRSALVLLAGGNDQDSTNGDHLRAYTSLFWCLASAYGDELDHAEYEVRQALRQMIMTQAEGEWLDVWAGLYGVPRLTGETDAELQTRIPEEVFRLRVNGLAIQKAVADVANESVTIDEPWKRMFLLDESALSGSHHMQDGQYYTYHVIQPVGVEGTDLSKVLPVVVRNKAAGIDVFTPRIDFTTREITVQPPVEYRVESGGIDTRGAGIFGTNDQILGVMRLSDNEITINHPCNRHDWWVKVLAPVILYEGLHTYDGEASYGDPLDAIHVGLQTHQQLTPYRSIAMASIPLSDGDPLGNENAVLSRGAMSVAFDPEPIPSDMMFLSGYDAVTTVERVEMITIAEHVAGLAWSFVGFDAEVQRADGRAYASNEAYPLRYWTNFADNQAFDGSLAYDNTRPYDGWNTDTPTPMTWDNRPWVPEWRHAGMTRTDTSI